MRKFIDVVFTVLIIISHVIYTDSVMTIVNGLSTAFPELGADVISSLKTLLLIVQIFLFIPSFSFIFKIWKRQHE